MKARRPRILLLVLIPLLVVCAALGYILSRSGHLSLNLPVSQKEQFSSTGLGSYPPRLHVSGRQILDLNGNVVLLKGLMPQDPARMAERGKFNRAFFEDIRKTGANVVRIPVHAENWVRDPDYLWRYLDPVVSWGGELRLYVIIDWHSIGNVVTGAGDQMPDIDQNSMELALSFWSRTARYFRGAPNVIFEIFNEPESITAEEWRGAAEKLTGAIRAEGASQLVIVGGLDFGKDLSWALQQPVADSNVAYASHIYPSHSQELWDGWFGKVAEKYPVISTEWGYMDENRSGAPSYLVGTRASYGEPFLNYLDDKQIGWVACWYDDEWLPPMFSKETGQMTSYGSFVMERLKQDK